MSSERSKLTELITAQAQQQTSAAAISHMQDMPDTIKISAIEGNMVPRPMTIFLTSTTVLRECGLCMCLACRKSDLA